jgi:hypothetical protein
MIFQGIVVIIALIILVITLIVVYFNLPKPSPIFPYSISDCPDNWQINPSTGKCVIPSEEISSANLGHLKGRGKPIYLYNFNNGDESLQLSYQGPRHDTNGIPYKVDGKTVYAYNTSYQQNMKNLDIPVGYYILSLDTDNDKETLLQNIIYNGNEIDFKDIGWSAYDGGGIRTCQIKQWLQENDIQWDGISNTNICPI